MEESILVLTTGGTIDKQYFDALSAYQITDTVIARMLDIARVTQPFSVEEITRKDSLDLDEIDRAKLLKRIETAREKRIVVTHGTDTMTDTARILSVVRSKTIVLVGALTPARFAESDAAFNLGMAFATAQIATRGVYITMNGHVFPANKVVKNRAQGAFVPIF
ncbi:asparaginase domain-containing protein [Sphingosinicella xenopeptidilytica]|uniref:Asparaginase domain-containing protein n=1 Tax=Sphingosinicella xenopeptidilytica TaxID=364098 RepID=A0ABW3C3M4_SPHXN